MRKTKRHVLRHILGAGIGASVVAGLAGCGGHDVPAPSASDTAYPQCSGTPPVASVRGYPVYRVSSSNADTCAIVAHYDAGYAIVADGDIDAWGPADAMPAFTFGSGVAASEPTGDGLIISTVPVAASEPVATKTEAATTYVLAKSVDNGAPIECQLQNSDTTQLQADIDNCLGTVRSSQVQQQSASRAGTASIKAQASDGGDGIGNANPDPAAWTLLGSSSQEVSLDSYTDNWWQSTQKTGTAALRFNVYRLNSTSHNDYYLVKALWDANPTPRTNSAHPNAKDACVKGHYCGYYNNLHSIAFSLSVVRNGQTTTGNVESYMPKTVERNKTVTEKMGGELSFGDKGIGGKVSGEVSTSFTYPALNLIASSTRGNIEFMTSYATSQSDIWAADPMTLGGGRTYAWGLFSVPEGDPSIEESVRVTVSKFEGNFGLRADNDLISRTYLYDYKVTQPYTVSFSPPVFGVKVINDDGTTGPVPTGRNNAIRLKAGESTELQITAGDYTTPVRLAWQLTSVPNWLVTSVEKGSVNSGNGKVLLTAQANATPGTLGYVMINTSPRAAAASVRNQDVAVPVMIVQ